MMSFVNFYGKYGLDKDLLHKFLIALATMLPVYLTIILFATIFSKFLSLVLLLMIVALIFAGLMTGLRIGFKEGWREAAPLLISASASPLYIIFSLMFEKVSGSFPFIIMSFVVVPFLMGTILLYSIFKAEKLIIKETL